MALQIPTPAAAPPDIVRCATAELIVTDLAASRRFYVDILGLVVTEEDDGAIYLRAFEEYLHHSLVIRKGPMAALRSLGFRVRTPHDVDAAEIYYKELGCQTKRSSSGFAKGIGDTLRVVDPLGITMDYFYEASHVERFTWRYDAFGPQAISMLEHFNVMVPDVPRGRKYMEDLGYRVSEDIKDDDDVTYAAWFFRKPTVHDLALTGGDGPRLHHIAFATKERDQILNLCDRMGAMRESDSIERGPGRHGVSNAFYLYLRDPDGHRIEIYTNDYYTGDPDNPIVTWDVHDNQRRDWWGNPIVPSWYLECSTILDIDGNPQPIVTRDDPGEMAVTIGADGFSYTRKGEEQRGFKIGHLV